MYGFYGGDNHGFSFYIIAEDIPSIWIFLNSQITVNIFSNRSLLTNII